MPQNMSQLYCIKRHMFFGVFDPIVAEDLTHEAAVAECSQLNTEEYESGDGLYVSYHVHKQ